MTSLRKPKCPAVNKAGAVAGCAYPISRVLLQGTLGFDAISPNSIDAVSDRDFIAEVLFAAAMIGTHLSRLAEDLIIYGSSEFGFVQFKCPVTLDVDAAGIPAVLVFADAHAIESKRAGDLKDARTTHRFLEFVVEPDGITARERDAL